MKVAMVSSFRTQCGNAINTEFISKDLSKLVELKIFAEEIFPPFTERPPMVDAESLDYERCWHRGSGFKKLEKKLSEYSPDIIHIHFSPGFFGGNYVQGEFLEFLSVLRSRGSKLILNLFDVIRYNPIYEKILSEWYKNTGAKFIVMNQDMSDALKQWYPQADVTLIPHGAPKFSPESTEEARKKLGLNSSDFLLISVGYYGPFKGMLGIINAIPKIDVPNFKVAFIGGFHPLSNKVHKAHIKDCIMQSIKLGVIKQVMFSNKLITMEEIGDWCSATDFYFSLTDAIEVHSASSVALFGFFPGKPTILGDGSRYSEFTDGGQCIKTSEDKIAEAVNRLYNDKNLQKKIVSGALEYAKRNSFEEIAKKHMELYEECLKS